jgi:hypothetical protein
VPEVEVEQHNIRLVFLDSSEGIGAARDGLRYFHARRRALNEFGKPPQHTSVIIHQNNAYRLDVNSMQHEGSCRI